MSELFEHGVVVFMAFFAIMNPIANTAVFAGLTGDMSRKSQIKIAIKSLLITFFVILAFSLLGKTIFHLFGITLPALRITGGILVFLVGYHMLHGEGSKLHKSKEPEPESDIAVSPLAVPLLAGPGTIATAMNYSSTGNVSEVIVTILSFALLCVVTFVCFVFSAKIIASIGESGLSIVTRLMGLILAVIGTQMIIIGVSAVMKSLNT